MITYLYRDLKPGMAFVGRTFETTYMVVSVVELTKHYVRVTFVIPRYDSVEFLEQDCLALAQAFSSDIHEKLA